MPDVINMMEAAEIIGLRREPTTSILLKGRVDKLPSKYPWL